MNQKQQDFLMINVWLPLARASMIGSVLGLFLSWLIIARVGW